MLETAALTHSQGKLDEECNELGIKSQRPWTIFTSRLDDWQKTSSILLLLNPVWKSCLLLFNFIIEWMEVVSFSCYFCLFAYCLVSCNEFSVLRSKINSSLHPQSKFNYCWNFLQHIFLPEDFVLWKWLWGIQLRHCAELTLYKCGNHIQLEKGTNQRIKGTLHIPFIQEFQESYQNNHNNHNKLTVYLPVGILLSVFPER